MALGELGLVTVAVPGLEVRGERTLDSLCRHCCLFMCVCVCVVGVLLFVRTEDQSWSWSWSLRQFDRRDETSRVCCDERQSLAGSEQGGS